MTSASKLRRLLFSLDISQDNASVIFAVKEVLFQGSVKNYGMLFEKCDNRRSPIKNFIVSLNLLEFQVYDLSAKFTAKSTNKYIPVR